MADDDFFGDGAEDDFAATAARERERLQRTAMKQGYISAVEDAKVRAAEQAYAVEFARALDEAKASAIAEIEGKLTAAGGGGAA